MSYSNFIQLCASNSSMILNIADSSWSSIDFSQDEPEIIREYLASTGKGVDYLNQNLSPVLSVNGFEMKFASVFVHQKPQITRVTSPTNRSCELGDLLLIFSFIDCNSTPYVNRAFLAQAKKGSTIDNVCQRELYDSDVCFNFPRNIWPHSPCSPTSPTRYLPCLLSSRWRALKYLFCGNMVPYIRYVPSTIGIRSNWSISVLGLLSGFDGLPFSRTPHPGNRWNAIIWDLLTVTAFSVLRGTPRGNGLSHLLSAFNSFTNYHKYFLAGDESSYGISTLLTIVKDNEFDVNRTR